jgi:hypothetical protein
VVAQGGASMSRRSDARETAQHLAQMHGGEPEDYLDDHNTVTWSGYQRGERRGGKVVAEYFYLDKDGENYLRVERTSDKQFPQSHWNGKEWKYGKPKGPKIPYNLSDLIAAEPDVPVYICEGEKDADNVAALGLVATCASEGAGKWTDDLNQWFAGKKNIYILQDNDDAGRKHAAKVERDLKGIVEQVRIVVLPGLPENGDVSDWLAAGGTKDKLVELCAAAPDAARKSSSIVRAADIVMRPKEWLWEGHLLRGAQELLTGIPGLGKSQVQIHYIACTTAGTTWPDGASSRLPANVVMLTAEDVLDQEVIPRLCAAGADLKRVYILKRIKSDGKDRQFLLSEDLDELERAVTSVGNVGLITIDPITAYMGGKIDSHKTTEVRAQLGPLKDFAERINVAISTITHPPKSSGQKAIDHFIGSQAFIAAGRIGHVCVEETEEEADGDDDHGARGKKERTKTGRVLFANAKNNPHTIMPTLAYRIEEIVVGQDPETGDNIAAPHVVWDKEPVDISADEAVVAAAGKGGHRESVRDAAQIEVQAFLQDVLKPGHPIQQKKIEEEAARRGFTDNQLRTAKKKLRIISKKSGFGEGGWLWLYAKNAF